MLNDYLLGILYGDGYLQKFKKREALFFSTTHKEIAERLTSALIKKDIKHFRYNRSCGGSTPKENYEVLEIVQITDQVFKTGWHGIVLKRLVGDCMMFSFKSIVFNNPEYISRLDTN